MTTLILVLLALLMLSASLAGLLIFRERTRGVRLLAIAPVPGALAVGILGVAYFLSYANNYGAITLFVFLLVLGAWVVGFVFCALAVLVARRLPRALHAPESLNRTDGSD